MAKTRTVGVPSSDGIVTIEMTNLEWGLQYVKLKIQEMVRRSSLGLTTNRPDSFSPQVYNGRKTDQCGVVVFGTPGTLCYSYYYVFWIISPHDSETQNILNERGDGYDHVYDYIPIAQPNSNTIAKLDALRATDVCGDRTFRRVSF